VRALCIAIALALVATGSAPAARGDPKQAIRPADQARAKAMLLRAPDAAGFTVTPAGADSPTPYCKPLDESDLTLTGDAESPSFAAGTTLLQSYAQVYASRAQSEASFRRGTSTAGERCARDVLRKELARDGVRLVSYERVAFPRVGEQSVMYRAVISGRGVAGYVDALLVRHGRAHAGLVFGSAVIPFDRIAEVRLAKVVAARMAKAMRVS
jgi:hypothetical protein